MSPARTIRSRPASRSKTRAGATWPTACSPTTARAYRPDVVAQARFGSPNVLLHIGGALHQIHDVAAWDCCYSPEHTLWGAAATAGGEYRFKWSNVVRPGGGRHLRPPAAAGRGGARRDRLSRHSVLRHRLCRRRRRRPQTNDGLFRDRLLRASVDADGEELDHLLDLRHLGGVGHGAARAERADVVRRQGARRAAAGRDRGHGAARPDHRRPRPATPGRRRPAITPARRRRR